MNEKLTFNNGTEIQGHQLETETRLFLYLFGVTLEEAFDLLKVPENAKAIKWERYGQTGTVRGYKTLMSVSVEQGGMIAASLKK